MFKNNDKSVSLRTKCVMYVQDLDHLGFESVEALVRRIKATDPDEWALIVHDKDEGQSPHVHAVIHWDSNRRINSIAKDFNDKPQYFEVWKGKRDNAYLYLTHRTERAKDKYQYSLDEVQSSFDYISFVNKKISEFKGRNSRSVSQKIDLILDKLDSGEISYKDAQKALTGSEYGRAYNKLLAVWQRVRKREADNWAYEMRTKGKKIKVLWAIRFR